MDHVVIRIRRATSAIVSLAALSCGHAAWAGEELQATPYRPTVSNPAELSAPGWLEFEAGLARTKGGGAAWQNNAPWLAKFAFSEDFGLLLGGDFRVRQVDTEGGTLRGSGDHLLALKHRWKLDDDSAFGLEWGAKLGTAATGIGTGADDYLFNGIYSRDVGAYRIDANLGATRLGLGEEGLARWQHPWAVAVSRPAGEDWTLALELSGVHRRGAPAATQALAAASYSVTKRLVFDFGVASRMSAGAPKWSAFAGFTFLAARFR